MSKSVFASLCFCFVMSGCAWVPAVESEPIAPSASYQSLLPVTELNLNLLMQQRVTIHWGDRRESFNAVFQKQGSRLLLVGMGPMNQVGFSLSLDGGGVHFDNRSGRALPFQPERILADVQRVFYPWISRGEAATPGDADDARSRRACFECERRGHRLGFDVWERIGPKFLAERRFQRSSGDDDREIVVHYEDWRDDVRVPARAVLNNEFYGYRLTIETLSVELLTSD